MAFRLSIRSAAKITFNQEMNMAKRPYIIIVNPDEMRADSMSHLGNPAAKTPNLDDFAENDAVSFSNAFCQNPVCVPSRCSFMTGLYPHVHGHRTMTYLLRPGEDSLLKELKESGYYVWMNDRNDLTAGQIDGWSESHADEIHYYEGTRRAPGPIHPVDKSENSKNRYSHFHGELGLDEQGENYTSDDEAIDAAIDRLLHPIDDRPIAIFLGLFYPHVPYEVEEPYFSSIDRKALPPRISSKDAKGKAPILSAIRDYSHTEQYEEKDWDELRATYLGMVSKVDHQFGKLVTALKKAGIYEDSAIFFFSDHGDFTGDYDLVEKDQNTFEDVLTRVPFLVKPPKGYELDQGVSSSLVELTDFYATALRFAGISSSHTHFGKDLTPILGDRKKENRDFVLCEGGREPGEIQADEYHQSGKNGPDPHNDYYPKMLAEKDDALHDKGIMLRDHRYKYVSRSHTQDEFYDLEKDPKELCNEIHNPVYHEEIQKKKDQLLKYLQQTADVVPFDIDSRFTKKMMWSKLKPLCPQGEEDNVKALIEQGMPFGALIFHCLELQKKGEK